MISVLSGINLFASEVMLKTVGYARFFSALEERRRVDKGILLDVRTLSEYDKGHAPTAVNIDYFGDDFQKRISVLDRDSAYFIYCHSGSRSGRTLKLMKRLGFKEVYNLSGGWLRNAKRLLAVKGQ